MPTPHINAKDGAFAKTVLMPGDPLRAKWIADNYLVDAQQVTNVRNIFGYTGHTREGKLVSVMASGMGQPSIGIYSHELYTHYGVETIIRVGTCGTYQEDIHLFDIIVASGSCTDGNWSGQFNLLGGTYSAISDFELTLSAYQAIKNHRLIPHVGNVLSSDVFYDVDPNSWMKWKKLGVLGVEMESYALYTTAARLNKKALCLLTVTDSFVDHSRRATAEERQNGLAKMIEVALEIA
ncbi:MAG: purine-nucleoside phosphorylase [Bacilli bacterium]|jgi:purine-nucleoside phosphorylase|nr:purine-nucleoside phosphorylase [Bacilli bacterium]